MGERAGERLPEELRDGGRDGEELRRLAVRLLKPISGDAAGDLLLVPRKLRSVYVLFNGGRNVFRSRPKKLDSLFPPSIPLPMSWTCDVSAASGETIAATKFEEDDMPRIKKVRQNDKTRDAERQYVLLRLLWGMRPTGRRRGRGTLSFIRGRQDGISVRGRCLMLMCVGRGLAQTQLRGTRPVDQVLPLQVCVQLPAHYSLFADRKTGSFQFLRAS